MQRLRRTIFITIWTVVGFIIWPTLLYLGLRLIVYGQRIYGWPPLSRWLPGWADVVVIYGMFGLGTLVVAGAMLVLGLRGRFPGTRRESDVHSPGFPVAPRGPTAAA
jgi:hypothetical protein